MLKGTHYHCLPFKKVKSIVTDGWNLFVGVDKDEFFVGSMLSCEKNMTHSYCGLPVAKIHVLLYLSQS